MSGVKRSGWIGDAGAAAEGSVRNLQCKGAAAGELKEESGDGDGVGEDSVVGSGLVTACSLVSSTSTWGCQSPVHKKGAVDKDEEVAAAIGAAAGASAADSAVAAANVGSGVDAEGAAAGECENDSVAGGREDTVGSDVVTAGSSVSKITTRGFKLSSKREAAGDDGKGRVAAALAVATAAGGAGAAGSGVEIGCLLVSQAVAWG